MLAEIIGGYLADSLALLADAGHMFSDAAALGLSLFAAWIAQRPPTPQAQLRLLPGRDSGRAGQRRHADRDLDRDLHRSLPSFDMRRRKVAGPLMVSIAAGGLVVNIAGLADPAAAASRKA